MPGQPVPTKSLYTYFSWSLDGHKVTVYFLSTKNNLIGWDRFEFLAWHPELYILLTKLCLQELSE